MTVTAASRTPLGAILLCRGAITGPQLAHALDRQHELGLPLGRTVITLAYTTDEQVRQALAEQLSLPYVDLEQTTLDPGLARIVNRSYSRRHQVVPVSLAGGTLRVALDDPASSVVADSLRHLTGFTIDVVVASSRAMQRAFRRLYDAPDASTTDGPRMDRAAESDRPGASALVSGNAFDEQTSQRADDVLRRLLQHALDERCSDLHLELLLSGMHLRYRVDGVLRQPHLGPLQAALDRNRREVVSRIKILSRLDIAERRRPQDGSFQFGIVRDGRAVSIDLRVSLVPTYFGESVVIRMLDRSRAPTSTADLNLSSDVASGLDGLLRRTTGIVLVTGPTGSGKSTTLYACLMKLHRPGIRILTAEDPVEYVYGGLSQCEVNDEIGNTFARYLRSFLRHDPEVIMVGEIRDEETARMAFRAAQTGHLLLSTLHTNSAVAALPRLLDLGIEPSLIASSLAGVLSQRLVRRICRPCRRESAPSASLLREFFTSPPDFACWEGAGCEACSFTGFAGRLIVADLWVPDAADSMLIARRAPLDDLCVSAARTTITMAHDAVARLRAGETTLEELRRVLPQPAVLDL